MDTGEFCYHYWINAGHKEGIIRIKNINTWYLQGDISTYIRRNPAVINLLSHIAGMKTGIHPDICEGWIDLDKSYSSYVNFQHFIKCYSFVNDNSIKTSLHVTAPYIVTKSHKSTGIAILLTLLFGPIGLFYASITGGLIMTFAPVILYLLLFTGLAIKSSFIMGLSTVFLIIFILFYWLINIIWAVMSVNDYNRRIDFEAQSQFNLMHALNATGQNQSGVNIYQQMPGNINMQGSTGQATVKPSLQSWLQGNPGKTINDYYSKYGR